MTTNQPQSGELKACPNPWCPTDLKSWMGDGKPRIAYAGLIFNAPPPSRPDKHYDKQVRCPRCELNGPSRATEAEAIAAWNTRLSAASGGGGTVRRPWCETCGATVAEVLCSTCAKWWADNPPPSEPSVYKEPGDCPLGTMHGFASTHGGPNGERLCDFCGLTVDPSPIPSQATADGDLVERVARDAYRAWTLATNEARHEHDRLDLRGIDFDDWWVTEALSPLQGKAFVSKWMAVAQAALTAIDIPGLLKAERERCAKVAEAQFDDRPRYMNIDQTDSYERACRDSAQAIRNLGPEQ